MTSMAYLLALFFATANAASIGDEASCLLQRSQQASIGDHSGYQFTDLISLGDDFQQNPMSKDTFSIWRYAGVDAIPASSTTKRVPVDWQIYTRYSGHPAFTRGLLLVDNSGGQRRQALEITARDCQWRARKGDQEWTVVKDGESLSVPEGNDYVTGFTMTKKDGLRGHSNVRLNMQMKDFAKDAALLSLVCRPKQHINFQMAMQQRSEGSMQGALKVPRMSFIEAAASFVAPAAPPAASFVESSKDSDRGVEVRSHWEALGGSAQAAEYFQTMEEAQKVSLSLLQTSSGEANHSHSKTSFAATSCGEEEQEQARKTCSKHLGSAKHRSSDAEAFFEDCVFDVCHGAGEDAAEMAEELMMSSRDS